MRVSNQWAGNHSFFRCCCLGTLMRVKNKQGPFGSLGMLVLGCILHLVFVEVPYFSSRTYGISTLVFCVMAVFACTQLVRAWLSDPGILPRRQSAYGPNFDAIMHRPRSINPQYFVCNGRRITLRYCSSCRMYQPPRAAHCIESNSCVMRFDHFCPWIGNTVGQRNYRYFFRFIVVGMFLLIDLLITCAIRIERHVSADEGGGDFSMQAFIFSCILCFFGFVFFCFILGMVVFHTYLQCTNQTTYEQVNDKWRNGNPHGYGWDIFWMLMTATDPSKFPRDEMVSSLDKASRVTELKAA